MKQKIPFIQTENHITGFIIRLTLGVVILPHGLQLLFGWFGGFGFTGSMNYFMQTAGLPWIISFLVILLQSAGAVLVLTGALARLNAAAIIILFTGMIVTAHLDHGFFMNWDGSQKGEGFEYHILVIGLAFLLMINGAGKYSLDFYLSNKKISND
jgi:putative oxidoreductase